MNFTDEPYKNGPRDQIPIGGLAQEAKLSFDECVDVFNYIKDTPFLSRRPAEFPDPQQTVSLSEHVLKYRKLKDVVDEILSFRSRPLVGSGSWSVPAMLDPNVAFV